MVSTNDRIAFPVACPGVGLYDSRALFNTHPVRNTPAPAARRVLGDTPLLIALLVTDKQTSDKFLITRFLMATNVAVNGFVTDDFVACFRGYLILPHPDAGPLRPLPECRVSLDHLLNWVKINVPTRATLCVAPGPDQFR